MSNDRLIDDGIFQPRDPGVDPWHVRKLLKELHVESESFEARETAVREYLENNTPGPTLRMGLRRSSYAHLMEKYDENHKFCEHRCILDALGVVVYVDPDCDKHGSKSEEK